MGLSCGIVGLPNVGKSTIFNALTQSQVDASNFPFCTIDPNVGVVPVPDSRLTAIAHRIQPEKVTPTTVSFVDIAGLVKGASEGQGLGNQFLGHIKSTDAIAHVVRCFEDANVTHVEGSVDPLRDISVIDTELMLADLATVTRRWEKVEKLAKAQAKLAPEFPTLDKIKRALEEGKPLRSLGLRPEEMAHLQDLHLLTLKPVLYVGNVLESHLLDPEANPHFRALKTQARIEGSQCVVMCGKIEAEISQLKDPQERRDFLNSLGLVHSGLDLLIQAAYSLLGLITFFTAGPKEVRAWTVRRGAKAPEAAGVIHSDFEKGFIRAEVYGYQQLIDLKTEQEIKAKGLMRLEGKDYVVQDGDVIFFRFNV
jgi:GTP-binding protein YchF